MYSHSHFKNMQYYMCFLYIFTLHSMQFGDKPLYSIRQEIPTFVNLNTRNEMIDLVMYHFVEWKTDAEKSQH